MVLFALMGGLLPTLWPEKYLATSLVQVEPPMLSTRYTQNPDFQESLETEQVVRSVWMRLISRHHLNEVVEEVNLYPELRDQVSNDEIIKTMRKALGMSIKYDAFSIWFENEDPKMAATAANALTEKLLSIHDKERLLILGERREKIQKEIEGIQKELAEFREPAAKDGPTDEVKQAADSGVSDRPEKYDQLRRKYTDLLQSKLDEKVAEDRELEEKDFKFILLDKAVPSNSPIRPDRRNTILLGAAIGLVAGIMAKNRFCRAAV